METKKTEYPQKASVISIYTEATPNPKTMKFVINRMLLPNKSIDFTSIDESIDKSLLAEELFGFSFVEGVFISNNFVTITQHGDTDWYDTIPSIKQHLIEFLKSEKTVVEQDTINTINNGTQKLEATTIEEKIREVLDKYVKPSVEMDGGAIIFKSFENGTVYVEMQGACNGCPSSTVTLKSGIEALLNRMVPEVKEVVALQ